jgi:glycosyltransferase involved in cell wall biosynthesis
LNDLDSLHSIDQILLTISKKELPNNLSSKFVATDQLSISDCIELYKNSSALIFPSLMESYGLPLIEAMYLDLPILVSKLPYAEWICGEQALYFDPYNIDSLKNCIKLFQQKLHDGWKPDYSEQLKKIPMDWHSFSQLFFN